MVPIGEWVLRQACQDAAMWPHPISVAVNLSPVQFRSRNLLASVADALATSGLAPHRLEVEITESILLHDSESNLAVLRALKLLGPGIALDNFGTGYSSLSFLRRFPFDKIKIDRGFVSELHADSQSGAIIRAVLGLGTSLGIPITSEGVETQSQLDYLRAEGCEQAQGYYLGRPIPGCETGAAILRIGVHQ
jgi:EAL domain-containing protein (putative c-di-GMP-specific phosphodiesterase class I)